MEADDNYMSMFSGFQGGRICSLRSKRFLASSSRKLGREQKKRNDGGGGGE